MELEDDYDADPDYFTIVIKPDHFIVYWKFVNDQIEIVIQAKTMSWIGIGWKSIDLNQSCQNFPSFAAVKAAKPNINATTYQNQSMVISIA